MRNKNHLKSKGFTLIEILMVLAIIGLIASIATYALTSARKRGRDTKRIADLKQVDTAVQQYIVDNNHAPYLGVMGCDSSNVSAQCKDNDTTGWLYLGPELAPYIQRLPVDPCGESCWRGGVDWFTYGYAAPGYEAYECDSLSCDLTDQELNSAYAVYAEDMEAQAPYSFKHGVGYSY